MRSSRVARLKLQRGTSREATSSKYGLWFLDSKSLREAAQFKYKDNFIRN